MIKQSIFRVARSRAFSMLVRLLEKLEHQQNLLRVLTYHRVDYPDARPDLDPNLISATPETFARQMEHIAEHYVVMTIDQVVQAVRDKSTLPPRSVLVTFDDAYYDFAEHAWPTLKRLGLPAVMFVPTAFPGQARQFWWDTVYEALHKCKVDRDLGKCGIEVFRNESRAQTYRRIVCELKLLLHDEVLARVAELSRQCELSPLVSPVMTWGELKNLAGQGLALGAHTQTHPLLNRVPLESAVEEAIGSLRELQSHVGDVAPVFAYPGGAFSDEVVQHLRDHFELAFTTCRGINDMGRADALRLRRINVSRHTPDSLVRAQMLAGVRHFNHRWPLDSSISCPNPGSCCC
ncbi:MAG TPA: polysaccharide deacetylase family protein [Pirellulaceae bacterium]|jgi:peptidoglycan/xylan/chitin deacetylase (PgdA/CDA1 family)|nr:polysaccharide deacetylase family protein [Pirellulaceae bacterium]